MKEKHNRSRTCCSKIHDITIKFDLFGNLIDKKYTDGLRLHRSVFGSLITLTFFTILILFAIYKYIGLKDYNDTNIMNSIYESYYSDDDIFKGGKNELNVAFGLIVYDGESDSGFS